MSKKCLKVCLMSKHVYAISILSINVYRETSRRHLYIPVDFSTCGDMQFSGCSRKWECVMVKWQPQTSTSPLASGPLSCAKHLLVTLLALQTLWRCDRRSPKPQNPRSVDFAPREKHHWQTISIAQAKIQASSEKIWWREFHQASPPLWLNHGFPTKWRMQTLAAGCHIA